VAKLFRAKGKIKKGENGIRKQKNYGGTKKNRENTERVEEIKAITREGGRPLPQSKEGRKVQSAFGKIPTGED